MITVYSRNGSHVTGNNLSRGQTPPPGTLWIDLLNPEDNERIFISTALGIDLPNILEMQEIEASSRLYTEGPAIYLTIDVLVGFDTEEPMLDAVLITFTPSCVVTVRYCEPRAIDIFANRIRNNPDLFATPEDGLLALLDALTDRTADILEMLGHRVDELSRQVFHRASFPSDAKPSKRRLPSKARPRKEKQLQDILQGIGQAGDLTHRIRDSVNGMIRLVTYLGPRFMPRLNPEQITQFNALERDARSLSEHAQFVAHETTFLLEATLGQINIEQNNIIKIFSIVAVIFLPPTLFASVWGMNFHHMPELDWVFGYPSAITVMFLSAVIPVLYFKHRGWM